MRGHTNFNGVALLFIPLLWPCSKDGTRCLEFCPHSELIYLLSTIHPHLEDHDLTLLQLQLYLILLLRELHCFKAVRQIINI